MDITTAVVIFVIAVACVIWIQKDNKNYEKGGKYYKNTEQTEHTHN